MPTICADDIRDAAFLSVAAYAETSVDLVNYLISEGWQPVGAPELGLDPSFFGADTSDSDYLYNFENAQGFIAYKDGTLAFAFAGTNPAELGDIRDDIEGRFTDFSGYYDKFQILRDAFWKFYYENEDALSLEKPLVTGHSLGGAAAEVFMNQYGVPFQDIIGISFGSPGISDFVTPFDGRFLAIEHTDDWVVDVFGDYFAVQEIGIELSVFLSLSSDLSLEEHYRAVYLDTVRHLFGPTEGAGPADELDPNYRSLTLEAQQIIHPAYFASEAAERFGTYEVYIADAAANDIRPGADDQIVFGLNGHDTIYGGGGSDLIDGGLDNDSLLGEDGDDIIHGNRGNDTIYGGNETTESQNDQLFGDEGNDAIFGEIGNDQLDGGSGNDLLSGGAGTDNLTGGSGRDTFVIDSTASSDFDAILDYNSGDTGSYSFTEGDRIDLSALVGAAYQGGADPDDFVRIVVGPDGQTSFLQVDVDGTGGGSGWQTVASIGVLPEGALVDFILGPGANDPNHTLRIETTSAGVSPSTWSITPSVQSLTEEDGATITFTITRPDASSEQTVYVSTVQTFGAINDGDYTGLLDVPVTFLAGVLSTDVMVTISGDSVPELDETFGVIVQTVINPSPSEYVAAATFSIIDNDDVAPGGTPTDGDDLIYVAPVVGDQSLDLSNGDDRVTVDFSAFSEDVTFSAYRSGFPATYRYHVAETVDGSHRLTLHSAESFNFLGGAGNDNISTLYRSGDDQLFGGAGDDTINGAAGNDIIDGGADNDNLSAGEGNDVVRGGAGNDTIDAGEGGADAIDGGSGIDRLNLVRSSATQAFTFTFEGGSDTTLSLIDGTTITDIEHLDFTAGAENDHITYVMNTVIEGTQSLSLGDGTDRVTVDFSAFSEDVTFSAYRSGFPATYRYHVAETVDGSHRLTLHSAESFNFLGGAGNDNISTLYRSGDDQLFGGAGDDTINGAAGNDIIDGGADNDNLSAGEGNDVVRGGAGNDTIDAGEGGADAIDGGSGIDRLNLVRSSATQAFTFTFDGGSDTTLSLIDGTTITDIEHLDFTAGAENDHITYVMNTVIEGTQSLSLGDGTDRVTVDFSAFSEDVTFSAYRSGFPATYRYHVAETVDGSHRLTLHSAESFNFLGGAGNDNISTLYRSGDDKLFGGAGDDTINGAAGNDIIDGGADNDNLSAGEGNDVVRGGAGNDTIDAGEGGADAIDGGSGIDRLNLVRSSATQAFTFTFDGGSDTTLSLIDGTTITGVEIFSFTSGSGDDDITYVMDATIDVQRTSLNLGDGFDRVTVDMSAYTSGVRFDDDRFGNLLATSGNWDGSNWSQQLKISNAEAYNFLGGSGNDVIYLQDVSGDHLVFGDDGDDEIRTHDGNDILNGGGGNDSLTGGDGADTFVLSPGDGQDTITDFELGLDTIDLSAFDRSDAEDAVENAAPGSAIITFSDGTVLTIQGDNVTPETLSQNDIVFADNVEPEGSLLIEGIAKEDEVLTADVSGVSDDDGIDPATETFQWQRDGIDIPGAEGSSYTLTQDDVQKQITVVYSYTDTFGTPESVTSAPTAPVENVNDPIQGFIVLTGTPAVGETLTADGSDITDEDGIVEGSITWGWYRLNQSFQTVERIPGAHQATYTVTEDDRGYYISPRFTYEDEFGGTGVRSSVGVYVNTPPSGDVMITGLAEDGQTLTVDISGINEPDTIRDNTLTYQWRRDGLDIVDATDTTYEVTSDDVGFELSVHVTYLDGGNTREELTSAAVAITDAPQPQVLTGTPDPDVLTAGDGNDTLRGLGSNDTLTGSAGNDLIDGGPGRDTAIYSGDQASYTLTLSPTSATLADRRADGNGTDQLIDIEFLDFETEIPALGGNPMNLEMFGGPTNLSEEQFGDLIELYIAYFNRAPDSMGLYFWATAYADGQSLEEIAALFSTAAETKALYPDGSSNEIFLENVYNNVLGRLPDQGGFDFWLGHLNSGALKKETFILDLLGGAQGSDVDYLNNKVDIGTYFAVIKGMSNGRNGSEVMELFDGTQQSIEEAIEATDQFYAEALDPDDGEFLMPLVGVVDDPFAVA
ncbi:DUF4214 domain-containing protein [Roseovarius sp.]|uniref:DUF4214 domain-containing protein n=1 Tax=Roseovarius sp. TaxID=1486281 RepID=UPI003BAC3E20